MSKKLALSGYRPWLYSAMLIVVAGSLLGLKSYKAHQVDLTKNFKPMYSLPVGWNQVPHGPTTLFKYAEPKTNLVLRGSVNQVISDYNPTPDLDTDGIANFYLDRTEEAMPDWKATKLPNYSNPTGTAFEIIRRSTKDRVVVTAYVVKGNTTLLITLFGKDRSMTYVDPGMDKLYRFLDTVSLREQDMSNL